MLRRILIIVTALLLCFHIGVFAATDIRIAASILDAHSMSVVLSKVVGSSWTTITDLVGTGMDFGQLTKGPDDIYRPGAYFVIDAPVTTNHPTWTVTHTRTNFQRDASTNLNNNVNVTFVKVANSNSAETQLTNGYVSYGNSNSKTYNQTDLLDSRLRIYYGIANGTTGNASGVTPITSTTPAGNYSGTVTLTLSP
jgi:hypothetical protein